MPKGSFKGIDWDSKHGSFPHMEHVITTTHIDDEEEAAPEAKPEEGGLLPASLKTPPRGTHYSINTVALAHNVTNFFRMSVDSPSKSQEEADDHSTVGYNDEDEVEDFCE